MKTVATQIEQTVTKYAGMVSRLNEKEFSAKKNPGKWSKKEILGHLLDSAQNNIQRFVRGQYENTPKIVYAQDDWVRLQNYQQYAKDDLIRLWVLLNRHLCVVLTSMAPANYELQCNVGSNEVKLHTLSFLAQDYLDHMLHHLNQLESRN